MRTSLPQKLSFEDEEAGVEVPANFATTPPSRATGAELAIVPTSLGLQVARLRELGHSPHIGALVSVPGVCPTCHRQLEEPELDDGVAHRDRRLTPQYFRALFAPKLSICDSPSTQQQQQQQQQQRQPVHRRRVWSRRCAKEKDAAQRSGEPRDDDVEPTETSVSPTGSDANNTGSSSYYGKYFLEIQKLGNGTFGGVYLCQHIMEGVPLGYFALKKIPVGDNIEYLQRVLSEVRILEEVKRHPNVVEYSHSWMEVAQIADFGPPVRCLFILMEYATEGSLDSYLERHNVVLPTIAVWYFFLSALSGTAHLHQKNILHRDLKPQNLLLTGPRERPPRVLVSDFGTAALLGELSYERTGGTGTMEYMAPELFERELGGGGAFIHAHTKAADVWSLGMILHYLSFGGMLPSRLPSGEIVLEVGARAPYFRPPEMVELIRAMLHRDPAKRPSCQEILNSTVVKTILRSFEKAKLHSDILPGMVFPRQHGGSTGNVEDENEDTPSPYSPLVDVPLLLQYKQHDARRTVPIPSAHLLKRGRKRVISRAVQTDYVRIVYDTPNDNSSMADLVHSSLSGQLSTKSL